MLNSYFISAHQSSQYVVKRDVSAEKASQEIPTKRLEKLMPGHQSDPCLRKRNAHKDHR